MLGIFDPEDGWTKEIYIDNELAQNKVFYEGLDCIRKI